LGISAPVTEKDIEVEDGKFWAMFSEAIASNESLLAGIEDSISDEIDKLTSGEINKIKYKLEKVVAGSNKGNQHVNISLKSSMKDDVTLTFLSVYRKYSSYSNNDLLDINGKVLVEVTNSLTEYIIDGKISFSGAFDGTIVFDNSEVDMMTGGTNMEKSVSCFIESGGNSMSVPISFIWGIILLLIEAEI
jgi:hypothetical protein